MKSMRKKYIKPLSVSTALLLTITSVTPVIANAESSQQTKVIGTFQATILDVQVPAVTNFIYNPNTEAMTTGSLTITSNTNAPIYANLEEINVSELSTWKPNLIAPDTFNSEQWRNLTKAQSKAQVSLGLHSLEGEGWLTEIENAQIWSNETNNINKLGTIRNHGVVDTQPTLKAGNSIPTEGLLTTNYIFEFGLETGKADDSNKLSVKLNDSFNVNNNGTLSFNNGWLVGSNPPDYIASDNSLLMGTKNLGVLQYNLPTTATKTTFELKAKVLSNSGTLSSAMVLESGDAGLHLYFYPERIDAGSVRYYLDGTQYHTYRIVNEGENFTIYVDGVNVGVTKSNSINGQHRVYFGDGTSFGDSVSYFKDVSVAPEEALYLD